MVGMVRQQIFVIAAGIFLGSMGVLIVLYLMLAFAINFGSGSPDPGKCPTSVFSYRPPGCVQP